MAEIKIVGSILNTSTISRYQTQDTNLVGSQRIQKEFDQNSDLIEFYLYDTGNNLINQNYNYKNYSNNNQGLNLDGTLSIIEIDPVNDIENIGYKSGDFTVQYNFFRNRISDITADLFITEISSDRTEIRATSINISDEDLFNDANTLINEINNSAYYVDYLLNFGSNSQVVVVNIAIEQLTNPNQTNILFKLYQPLPSSIDIKTSFWVVEEILEPYVFSVDLSALIIPDLLPQIKGPNFDISVKNINTTNTKYQNYNDLVNNISGSNNTPYYQYLSMDKKSLSINTDYTNFSEFSHFGSIEKRLELFYNKVKQIEDYGNYISGSNSLTSSYSLLSDNLLNINVDINNIVMTFDEYERFLYFESGSSSWPKISSTRPYLLKSTGSAEVIAWYNNNINNAIEYDLNNSDYLIYTIPEFIREDENNEQYLDFVRLAGHFFDNIWIYISSITNIWENNNNLYEGISKDLVSLMLTSLGVNLYNGIVDNGTKDYLTGNYLGSPSEYSQLTSSYIDNIPKKDLVSELYKRIYSNLPLLVKSKGTKSGLQNIITLFGLNNTLLNVNEYGINGFSNMPYSTNQSTFSSTTIIEGNVITPNISTQPIYSFNTTANFSTSNILDISFNPQNQFDSAITNIIYTSGSVNDFIGDPGYEYSSSYEYLENIRKDIIKEQNWNKYDFNGYIKLVKYFENSLFKVLKDNVPGRSETLTGVTIRPQFLERPKIKKYRPEFTQLSFQDSKFKLLSISEGIDNEYIYNLLTGDKRSYYDGNISGSTYEIHEHFLDLNVNPYTQPSFLLDTNNFNHSDFDALFNNLTSSLVSKIKKKLENNNITSSLEYNDFNNSLTSFIQSRYAGCKSLSSKYNIYSDGDSSYGKTAAIDKYAPKIAVFSQVSESLLSRKNEITLKYLVDEFGTITELNGSNLNLENVQRLFKAGDDLTISLFNVKKYFNNASPVNGVKPIFNSGYSYTPIYYLSSSYNSSSFEYTDNNLINTFSAFDYILFQDNIPTLHPTYSVFDSTTTIISNNGDNFITGSTSAHRFSKYTSTISNNYIFSLELKGLIQQAFVNQSSGIVFNMVKNGTTILTTRSGNSVTAFTSSYKSLLIGDPLISPCYLIEGGYHGVPAGGFTASILSNNVYSSLDNSLIASSGTTIYRGNFTINLTSFDGCTSVMEYASSFEGFVLDPNSGVEETFLCGDGGGGYAILRDFKNHAYTKDEVAFNSFIDNTIVSNPIELDPGDYVEFQFSASTSTSAITDPPILISFTASLSNSINNVDGSVRIVENPQNDIVFLPPNTLSITGDLNDVLNFQFAPSGTLSLDDGSLFFKYGYVNYPFTFEEGNVLKVLMNDNSFYEFNVQGVFPTDSNISLELDRNFSSISMNDVDQILILKKIEDETNIVVTFNKPPGPTSYGFLIPQNVSPDVMNNIDSITSIVKQKLIDLAQDVS